MAHVFEEGTTHIRWQRDDLARIGILGGRGEEQERGVEQGTVLNDADPADLLQDKEAAAAIAACECYDGHGHVVQATPGNDRRHGRRDVAGNRDCRV